MENIFGLFFFSSRRRHTRCGRDWSSDVCSSDLNILAVIALVAAALLIWSLFDKRYAKLLITAGGLWLTVSFLIGVLAPQLVEDLYVRSEERRVGKECRSV